MSMMRYVLTDPRGRVVARADSAGILIDAAVARLTTTDLWRDTDEWRVWYETPIAGDAYRRLRYGVSVQYGVYGIDGSGVPTTVVLTLPQYLAQKHGPADEGGAVDPKDPDYERKVTP